MAGLGQLASQVTAGGARSVAVGGNASAPIVTGDYATVVSRVAVARRAVFLPARRRVAGRERLLAGLRQQLAALTSAKGRSPGVLVLHGLGGWASPAWAWSTPTGTGPPGTTGWCGG